MRGHDHALSGALAFAAVAPLLHVTGANLAAGIALTAGAGLLPDLDEPGSTIAREGGFLTMALAWVVHRVSGGHRKGTHSLAGIAVFTAAAALAVTFDAAIWARVVLWLFLALLLGAGLHAVRLGGHHGDVLALAAAGVAVWWHAGLSWVPLCIALGALAHLAGDMCTHHGCPLLYPLDRRDFGLLPEPLRISTGKFAEHWVVSPLLVAGLVFLAWHDTATTLPAIHTAIGR